MDSSGNIFAKNAFLEDGTFTGDIITPIIHYSTKNFGDKCLTFSKNKNVKELFFQYKDYCDKLTRGFCSYKGQIFNTFELFMVKKGYIEHTFGVGTIEYLSDFYKLTFYGSSYKIFSFGSYSVTDFHPFNGTVDANDLLEEDINFYVGGMDKTLYLNNLPT